MTLLRREPLLTAVLAVACLGLGFVLHHQWTRIDPAERVRAVPALGPSHAQMPLPEPQLALLPEASAADDAVIIERPLFAPSRRPPPNAEPPAEAPAAQPPPAIVLRGVVHSRGTRKVIVENTADLSLTRLREGDSVDGWEIAAIHPKKVVLRQGSVTVEVPLPKDRAPRP